MKSIFCIPFTVVTIPTLDGTGLGQLCVIPFLYRNQRLIACTNVNYANYWCSTSSNYDIDQKFGLCPCK